MQMNNVGCIIFDRKISSNTGSKNPAMIFPRDSEIYSLYTDTNGTTFVQTPGENRVFFLREEWTHIKDVIKNDSMVLAIEPGTWRKWTHSFTTSCTTRKVK